MIFTAFSRAWSVYRRRFSYLMLLLFLMLVITAACACPLLGLLKPATRLIALLCPVLFVLVLLPVRQNMADVLLQLDTEDRLNAAALLDFSDYGKKLKLGLRTTLLMLVWALPFLAASGYAYYAYKGDPAVTGMDVFTIVRKLMALGGGSFVTGAVRLALIYLLTALPVAVGLAFHSGTRHARAMGDVRIARRCRPGAVTGWIISLVTFIPFAIAAYFICRGYISALLASVNNLMSGSFSLPPIDSNAYLLLAAFAVLALPVLPLRALITACYMHLKGNRQ